MIRNLIQVDINKVPPLAFHTMNLCDDFIVIYGGLKAIDIISGDLVFLKLSKNKFMIASYENNKNYFPKPRHSHSAVFYKTNKKLYVFGGIVEGQPKYSDELWSLDISTKPSFTLLKQTVISNRCRHVSFIHRKRLYIYGGYGINKITKKFQILNDFFYFSIEEGPESMMELITKGGIDMNSNLFKVVKLTDDNEEDNDDENLTSQAQFAFFCSDLSKFFILDMGTETFIKVQPKFVLHSGMRENFTVDRLSDGRIVLYGGMMEDTCSNEAFILVSFYYTQKDKSTKDNENGLFEGNIHYTWNDVDLFGNLNETNDREYGFNGHASARLPNDHILIYGGTQEVFFPVLYNFKPTNDPQFTRRCKIIDVFNTYQWEAPVKTNAEKLHIYPRILHISQIIPKENRDSHSFIFFHGGEYNQKMLCHYSLYDLDDEVWLPIENDDYCPQLKSHACSYIYDPERKEFYVIIMGGMYKEHLSNCEAETNKQRERCGCVTEFINNKIYAYRNNKFFNINLENTDDYFDKIKRLGHNMVTGPDGCIYLLCGFAQYIGYLVDIIRFRPKADVKNKTFYFECETLETSKEMDGRMYATCQMVHNNIIIFGGIKDDHTLNDLWIINISQNNTTAKKVESETNWIYPRFGMTSIMNMGPSHENSTRLVIFGGSYWCGKQLVYGMTNEILVFYLKFQDENFTEFDVKQFIPTVYGKGMKRIFHQSFYYQGKMLTFGGSNNLIFKFKMPIVSNLEYNNSLSEYINFYPRIHYTTLIIPQEIENENKFESTSKLIKSKNEQSNRSIVKDDSLSKKDNSNNIKGNDVNLSQTKISNINDFSNIELISMDKSKGSISKRDNDENDLLGDETGRSNLVSNKSDTKKKKFVIKKKEWNKDYK